jgi:hypothetical protein
MIAYIVLRDHTLGWLIITIWIGGLYMVNKDFKFLLTRYSKKNMLPKVMKYSLCFKNLTIVLQQREPFLYDIQIIINILKEFENRFFYPDRIIKPSKKGTCIIFKNIFDKDGIDQAEKNINKLILSFNDKYKKDLVLLKIKKGSESN